MRQRVHALLGSYTWRECWLGVLDDLQAPEEMEAANMDWLLKEFPWTGGQWQNSPQALFKGTKCGNSREVYCSCRKCQQKAWKAHKLLCQQIVADKRSVSDIVRLQVGNFAEEEACSWIKGKVLQWEGDAEGILALVRHLECFPLAVALAAAHACSDKTATPAMYLDALKRTGIKRAKGRGTTGEYPECFPDVVKLLLDNLLQSDQAHAEDAGQALRKLALLDTEAIPLDLLGAGEKQAVLLLQAHSLVTVDDTGCAAMHAVTQLVVRDWLTPKAQRSVLVAALAAVLASKLRKFNPEKPATFFIGRRYARHAGAVAARARKWGGLPVARPGLAGGSGGVDAGLGGTGADSAVLENIGDMCQRAGFFFERVSVQPREALHMHEAALHSAIARHGNDHRSVAACYGNIGNVYQAQGEYDEALVQLQKCLKIDICVLGCEHPQVATAYHNIGGVYRMQGDYENALLQHQKSLEIKIRIFGCDSAEVAKSYNSIGILYTGQGDYQNALRQHHKSLEINLRVYGQKHPLVAGSYHNIGVVYRSQGKGEEALDHCTKALEIYVRVYGQDHPRVADSKYNMGQVYAERNEMDMAHELFLECQRIYSKVHGPGHSDTVTAADAAQRTSRCVEESV